MRFACLAFVLAFAALPAIGAPFRAAGVIEAFDGQSISVKTSDGQTLVVAVRPTTRYRYNARESLADIKPGDFVGAAAIRKADGKLHAEEVHVFPPEMRGLGEGQYPMAADNRSMTNATVAQVTSISSGGEITLSYHGAGPAGDADCTGHAVAGGKGCVGTAQIEVAPGVPVIAIMPGDASLVLPGMAVLLSVGQDAQGTPYAAGMTVEKNGVKPML